jgi:glycosyltransferase involved in cell wall biosynthesis
VIPAFNEEKRLPASLTAIAEYLDGHSGGEMLVVDDGSSDGTAECVRSFARARKNTRLLQNPGNRGKGYSVRHGMLEARNEWILSTDADLSAPIEDVERLFEAAARGNAEVAIGSRALDRSLIGVHQPKSREVAGIVFNAVMRAITGLPFRDTQCGFKLFGRKAARSIFSRQRLDGFGFDVEDLYIAKILGIRVLEVPVRWNNVEGTKVSLSQGLNSFLDPLRIRWNDLRGKYRS